MSGVIVFDLETTDLRANMGHILVACAKKVGTDHTYTWRIDETEGYGDSPKSMMDDSAIVTSLIEYMSDADAIVAHFGTYFDHPYLNTRALIHGLDPLPPVHVIDPWKTAKKMLRLTNNRMGTVAEALGCSEQKYQLPWSDWRIAHYGDKAAMKRLTDYCINDVLTLEDVYLKLLPLMRHHPYVGPAANDVYDDGDHYACPACASTRIQRRGIRRTKKQVIRRLQCQNCGNWADGRRRTIGIPLVA